MTDLQYYVDVWLKSKEQERIAVEARREAEDRMLSLLCIANNKEGTTKAQAPNGAEIKVVNRFTQEIDNDLLQEIAIENGLTEHLHTLFRWKPSVDAKAWKSTHEDITKVLQQAITSKPARASFSITQEI